MTPKWRQFEKLIARIEHAMAPSGAVVTSPDRIPDKVTGQLREVDASIRCNVGTCPVLITIECRDRTSVEDVRWIEQLGEKQRSVGAAITVAVSSSGFTDPAIKKATALGIQVRTLTDASAEAFIHWLTFENVELDVSEWALAELALELYDAPDDAELTPASQQSFRQQGPLAPIFVSNSDGKRLNVENILVKWTKGKGTFFPDDLPANGTNVRRDLHQRLERGCLHVETNEGNYDIRVIHIGLSLCRSKVPVPVARLSEYADSGSALVQTAEWDLQQNIKLSLHRDLKSRATEVRFTADETRNGA